jgi:hypothetical protein
LSNSSFAEKRARNVYEMGSRLREVMLKGVREGYEQFKNSGNDLGVGLTVHNFAQSSPVTQPELDGLKKGALRVHILLGGAWTSETGEQSYWTNAEWTNWPQVALAASFWKGA